MIKKLYFIFFILSVFSCFKNHASEVKNRPNAIIIGASSGIGRALAQVLSKDYNIGLVARREEKLKEVQQEIKKISPICETWVKSIDVSCDKSGELLKQFINEIGGLDLIIISISSVADTRNKSVEERDKKLIEVDLIGFLKMVNVAIEYFKKQKTGYLVGISSIDALRGNPACPVYSATKAFISTGLGGFRNQLHQEGLDNVFVTDVLPGYVQTEGFDPQNNPNAYWITSAQDAALQIYDAIKSKQKTVYVSRRWWLIALLMEYLPDWIFYDLLGGL